METVDGLTYQEVKWNVYAFGRKLKEFARKRDNARKDHTRAKWQKKCDECAIYLGNNQARLARFEAVQHALALDAVPAGDSVQ